MSKALLILLSLVSSMASYHCYTQEIKTCYFYTVKGEASNQQIAEHEAATAAGEIIPFEKDIFCVLSIISNSIDSARSVPSVIVGGGGSGTSERRGVFFSMGNETFIVGDKVPDADIDKYNNMLDFSFNSLVESSFIVAPDIDAYKALRALKSAQDTIVVSDSAIDILNLEAQRNGFIDLKGMFSLQPNTELSTTINAKDIDVSKLNFFNDKEKGITFMIPEKLLEAKQLQTQKR